MADLYNKDFYAWANRQADCLEKELFKELDLDNLLEEVDCMGKKHLHKFESHMALLLMHLLKWKFQPVKRQYGHSWEVSIRAHRAHAKDVIVKHPSLGSQVIKHYAKNYQEAIEMACIETGLSKNLFPAECPWTFEQIMQDCWLPPEDDA